MNSDVRFGPARNSPSRLQRSIVGAPTLVVALAIGVPSALTVILLAVLRGYGLVPAVLLAAVSYVVTVALFIVLKGRTHESADARLDRIVAYPPRLLSGRPVLTTVPRVWLRVLLVVCAIGLLLDLMMLPSPPWYTLSLAILQVVTIALCWRELRSR